MVSRRPVVLDRNSTPDVVVVKDDEYNAVNYETSDAQLNSSVVVDRNFSDDMDAAMKNAIFNNDMTNDPEKYWHEREGGTKFQSLQMNQVPKELSASAAARVLRTGSVPDTTLKHTRITFRVEELMSAEMIERIKKYIYGGWDLKEVTITLAFSLECYYPKSRWSIFPFCIHEGVLTDSNYTLKALLMYGF